jgi:uncharacterized protein (TIGR00296 family)
MMFVTYIHFDHSPPEKDWRAVVKDGKLRGCIGFMGNADVQEDLGRLANTAAFDDKRFEALTLNMLPEITCAVSYLSDLEKAASWDDWEVGKHGVVGILEHKGKVYQSTYLPEVPMMRGWDKRTTMLRILKKAKYPEVPTDATLLSMVLYRYQSSKFVITWQEYQEALAARAAAALTGAPSAAAAASSSSEAPGSERG